MVIGGIEYKTVKMAENGKKHTKWQNSVKVGKMAEECIKQAKWHSIEKNCDRVYEKSTSGEILKFTILSKTW